MGASQTPSNTPTERPGRGKSGSVRSGRSNNVSRTDSCTRAQMLPVRLPPPQERLINYLQTPIMCLPATAAPIMSGMKEDGHREPDINRTQVHPFQRYFVQNRCHDIYHTTRIHVPNLDPISTLSPPEKQHQSFLNQCKTAFLVEKEFDYPVAYEIRSGEHPLLRLQQARIPDIWEVYNGVLFSDIKQGIVVGRVHTFKSAIGNILFAFVPSRTVLIGVPTMHMEHVPQRSKGGDYGPAEYKLSVSLVDKPVGSVTVRRHFFDVALRDCTREEALIWLCLLIAAELETKAAFVSVVPSH